MVDTLSSLIVGWQKLHLLLLEARSDFRTDLFLTDALWWFLVLWLGALGGCVGSFLTVVWDRLGSDEGFVLPRSRCPECDREIRWYHNIPVIGWLLLRGRCYDCGSRIPLKHPLIEAIFALAFMAAGIASPWL
jgi:prepilin signal peptidase PulO-like enzyme (type II secretory pathway)